MGGKSYTESFDAGRDDVYAAAVEAMARLGYTALEARPEAGLLSFNTGRSVWSWAGQDLTATVINTSPATSQVIVGGSLARHGAMLQLGAWGEKGRVAQTFLKTVRLCLESREPRSAD